MFPSTYKVTRPKQDTNLTSLSSKIPLRTQFYPRDEPNPDWIICERQGRDLWQNLLERTSDDDLMNTSADLLVAPAPSQYSARRQRPVFDTQCSAAGLFDVIDYLEGGDGRRPQGVPEICPSPFMRYEFSSLGLWPRPWAFTVEVSLGARVVVMTNIALPQVAPRLGQRPYYPPWWNAVVASWDWSGRALPGLWTMRFVGVLNVTDPQTRSVLQDITARQPPNINRPPSRAYCQWLEQQGMSGAVKQISRRNESLESGTGDASCAKSTSPARSTPSPQNMRSKPRGLRLRASRSSSRNASTRVPVSRRQDSDEEDDFDAGLRPISDASTWRFAPSDTDGNFYAILGSSGAKGAVEMISQQAASFATRDASESVVKVKRIKYVWLQRYRSSEMRDGSTGRGTLPYRYDLGFTYTDVDLPS